MLQNLSLRFQFVALTLTLSTCFFLSQARNSLHGDAINCPPEYPSVFESAHPKFLRFGRASPSLYDIFGLEAHLRPPTKDEFEFGQ
uniref:Uncharacterized protein n=1 Tax=Globodera rostochiensis TaxID=31243 RepID=A0A914I0A6_GLORO